MTEERDNQPAGAPIEEDAPTDTEVQAAVDRAAETLPPASAPEGYQPPPPVGDPSLSEQPAVSDLQAEAAAAPPGTTVGLETQPHVERPLIAEAAELPSAGPTPVPPIAAEQQSYPQTAAMGGLGPARDGEIRVSPDHPMAPLYVQSPIPPDLKGNRGAGVFIALLATIAFAVVSAGVIALYLAPIHPPSTYLSEGLLPLLTSWGFIASVVAFFVGLVILVLIVGRAGWWAYVLGGFPVAVFVWAAATVGYAFLWRDIGAFPSGIPWTAPIVIINVVGIVPPTLIAAVCAREVTVWFGAWIGARGRRMKKRNAELLAEYDAARAEMQAPQL